MPDEHVDKEDFRLFPAAPATLEGADWAAMDHWEREHLLSGPAAEGVRS